MDIIERLFGSTKDPDKLYRRGLRLFERNRFREAAEKLQQAGTLNATSAQIQWALGLACSRVAGEEENDEQAERAWMERSTDAFRTAVALAAQHGGLSDEAIVTARDAVFAWHRITGQEDPALPEERRKKIFADYMKAKASEHDQVRDIADGLGPAFIQPSLGFLQKLGENLSNAESKKESVIAEIVEQYGITKGMLLAIEQEGNEKTWADS